MKVARIFSLILLASMVLVACGPAASTAGPVGTPVAQIPDSFARPGETLADLHRFSIPASGIL